MDINIGDIDYIIECSEEACGDMNQRGGGNFAKAIGETLGLNNATGSDLRSFCAAPSHPLLVLLDLLNLESTRMFLLLQVELQLNLP